MNFSTLKKTILFLVVLAGFLLRVWGIGFGLPELYHQDEPIVVNHAMAYGAGDLNPHYFALPPFLSYLLFALYGALYFFGRAAGMWAGTMEMALSFLKDPTVFYLAGRFASGVVPGTASVILTYFLARRFCGEGASLYAAAVMALAFLNVVNSHYIYMDSFLVLFTVASYIAFCRIISLSYSL